MSATGRPVLLALLVVLPVTARAQERQPTLADVPAIDRQRPHFYQALAAPGRAVQVEWTAAPATVPLDGEVTLTLTVRNAANPHELKRPDLGQMEAINRHFQVLDRPDPPPKPGAAEVTYTYVLRPRELGAAPLPRLEYAYYRPDLSRERRFRTTFTAPLTITVVPPAPAAAVAPPVPLEAPEWFLVIASPAQVVSPGRFGWLLPVAAIPPAVLGWVLVWRWLFPDAVRLARLRRTRAVRVALDRLKRAGHSPDPAAAAASAFRNYLTTRFGVPPQAQTPAEIAAALRDLDLPGDRASQAEQLLRRADGARFSGHPDDSHSLVLATEALIRAWEGEAE